MNLINQKNHTRKSVIGFLSIMIFCVLFVALFRPIQFKRDPAGLFGPKKTAYQVWAELMEEGVSFRATNRKMTFGGEKEGSSALITRVAGPTSELFISFVNVLPSESKEKFLRHFMTNLVKENGELTRGQVRGKTVNLLHELRDNRNRLKKIDMRPYQNTDYSTAPLEKLMTDFKRWSYATMNSPFSYLSEKARGEIMLGTFPGADKKYVNIQLGGEKYFYWRANLGEAQNYIDGVQSNSTGWELNFKKQNTYGEFEKMISWFRHRLKHNGHLYEAPGHNWLVFPTRVLKNNKDKVDEFMKVTQMYLLLKSMMGGTGIQDSQFKELKPDVFIGNKERGLLRIEEGRFGIGKTGMEIRAGVKTQKTRRFIETAFISRFTTNDFSGIRNVDDWTMIKHTGGISQMIEEACTELGYNSIQYKHLQNLAKATSAENEYFLFLPLFHGWRDVNNPFVPELKRAFLNELSKDFIEELMDLSPEDPDLKMKLVHMNRKWAKSSNLVQDMKVYLRPRNRDYSGQFVHKFQRKFRNTLYAKRNLVDVNQIDLGVEYSGNFPLKVANSFAGKDLSEDELVWIRTDVDLTLEERTLLIKKMAKDMDDQLGGGGSVVQVLDGNDHGHNLDIKFRLTDNLGREWNFEWDGIARDYSLDNEVILSSVRGGSVEVATPKFVPSENDIVSLYKVFDMNDIHPNLSTGGGHLNFDLAAFKGKPKEFARFLSIFHEHRGIISLMFQNMERLKAGEPIDVSPKLAKELRNFNGTEEELKQLLYNERYFNTRQGRKTRYVQMNVTSYFQDVIPEEFISEDFDIKNPAVPWRENFLVDSKIRKGEARLFNAPRDAYESMMQIKLLRAMLDLALNDTSPLSGHVQAVNYERYVRNPNLVHTDLEKMCQKLGLNTDDFRPFASEGLGRAHGYMSLKTYLPLSERLVEHPKVSTWKEAVPARSAADHLDSSDRMWRAEGNVRIDSDRVAQVRKLDDIRSKASPDPVMDVFHRTSKHSCAGFLRTFLPK